ncbi:hypothetical protein CONCODRAFT_85374 [Conidiobolus coronatus NRRL 28638]|uniref:Transmembrane protein 198 n=1 Tax=Conidiobolus coronatus (strain ATCC 28846 / CBS 209.66 / NRRL 28638) TaxID=796925 RepID=A0A137P5Q3_CONC2|nr:hypothetical protein CONCODRAFT_85374 [Conidiobolus coronatus NRRL 28638]|eukprot:KXN70342.1 hypothetical protein CONCODRAFT_85374 [Conidiobolus coronatus NRRL 28638]
MEFVLLSLLFLFMVISGASAQQIIESPAGSVRTDAGSIIMCIVLVLIGLTFVFTAKRIIKFILFIAGFIFFALVCVWIASLIINFSNISNAQMGGIIVCSIISGIIGGALSWSLYQVGIIILGFMGGFVLASLILSGVTSFDNYWARFGIMVAIGVIIAVITFIFMDFMIIITTSFIGSQAFMIGVDAVANEGYAQFAQIASETRAVIMTPALWAMLGSSIVTTIIGIIFQYKAYPQRSYHYKFRR